MLLCAALLLTIYFCIDTYHYRKEDLRVPADEAHEKLRLVGIRNFIFLAGVVLAMFIPLKSPTDPNYSPLP